MKVLTQIVTVLIAINLITASTALAQEPSEAQLRLIEETTTEVAEKAADVARKAVDMAAKEAQMQAGVAEQMQRLGLLLGQTKQGADRVLVVLTNPLKAQEVAATTEDLNIMSRIFDKKLYPGYASYRGRFSSAANIGFAFRAWPGLDGSGGTQAIYLHGYAALFLMTVDFPLAPPPKVEPEKGQEHADPLWEITRREIAASDKTGAEDYPDVYRDVKYDSEFGKLGRAAQEYDADKVEDLKTDLTKALRHAANIRNLMPNESIILAVAGTQPGPGGLQQVAVKNGKTLRLVSRNVETSVPFGGALLTIRAKKSDIDAYAKGELDLDAFRERVQFLSAHVSSGPIH